MAKKSSMAKEIAKVAADKRRKQSRKKSTESEPSEKFWAVDMMNSVEAPAHIKKKYKKEREAKAKADAEYRKNYYKKKK